MSSVPTETNNAEDKLRKLGQRVLAGWVKKHPISNRQLATVRGVIREEWEKEQKATRERAVKRKRAKGRESEPPEPGDDR